MSPLELHVLLALARGPLYGYAIKSAIEEDSAGAHRPGAGSLYRLIARLIGAGLVAETAPPEDAEPHPGLARRYYRLTAAGEQALGDETYRLRQVAALAAERLGLTGEDGR
ncbi:MAG: PadR family transcriptional regulator [Acidobacteria bacterium]|nr:MAG: PadR family transcriptional regulator [Acidobacteriota bacterium]REK09631.1 MAG: PadR family transcriptional regulator [Acidobacteriota bacterium]